MKDDIKRVNQIAKKHGMTHEQRRDFGTYIPKQKAQGNTGSEPKGDFTYQKLDKLAAEFMGD